MWETWVRSLGGEDPLEKEMATHSSTVAWKIPRTEKPGRLQSMGSQRVGHDWATSLSLSWEIVEGGGAWHAAVHGVTETWTWLNDWTSTTKKLVENVNRFIITECNFEWDCKQFYDKTKNDKTILRGEKGASSEKCQWRGHSQRLYNKLIHWALSSVSESAFA